MSTGPAAEAAEARRDALERGEQETRRAPERAAVYGSTADDPERHFLGWLDDVDPDELFVSGPGLGPLGRPARRRKLDVDAARVSLLRWLRQQLREPAAIREHLEAAVENDDPAEARRLLERAPVQ